MRRQLETLSPAEMGWPRLTPDELVERERRCWFDDEDNEGQGGVSAEELEVLLSKPEEGQK